MKAKFWPLEKEIKKRLTSIEMKFFRRTAGCTLSDHNREEEVLEELKVEPAGKETGRHKSNWLRHVTTVDSSRMANIKLNCRPNGRRRLGRPLKGQLDEAETGLSRPNWWRMMMTMMILSDSCRLPIVLTGLTHPTVHPEVGVPSERKYDSWHMK